MRLKAAMERSKKLQGRPTEEEVSRVASRASEETHLEEERQGEEVAEEKCFILSRTLTLTIT